MRRADKILQLLKNAEAEACSSAAVKTSTYGLDNGENIDNDKSVIQETELNDDSKEGTHVVQLNEAIENEKDEPPNDDMYFDGYDSAEDMLYVPSSDESHDSDNGEDHDYDRRDIHETEPSSDREDDSKERGERMHMRSRWKSANPSSWKRNRENEKRKQGVIYCSTKGKVQSAKLPRPVDCAKCRYNCTTNFSDAERKALCSSFWNLPYERQKDFIILNVKLNVPKRKRPRKEESNVVRTNSKEYYFVKDGGSKTHVCQKFFLKTLCISNAPVINAFKNINQSGQYGGIDKRGRNSPGNKTSQVMKDEVKAHIESFPTVESHYTRKATKRLYLDPTLTISKMYLLYKEKCMHKNEPYVQEITYRRIFCTEYNLSFFKPKKDQCVLCNQFEKALPEDKVKMEDIYKEHIERKTESMAEKEKDKQKASIEKDFKSITCDLQSVLQIPTSPVSLLYYLRKINLYNFTVYEADPPNAAFCYFWTEMNGKRGSCEIGSCLAMYIACLKPEVTHLTIFSDTCGGQNRNIQVAALLLHTVTSHPTLNTIEQKFMESGHSFMEVDSMHSAIEKAKKNIEIFSAHEWQTIFKMARTSKKGKDPYNTRELVYSDFLDLKNLVQNTVTNKKKDDDGNDVNWLKVKCLMYKKDVPNIIQYKYNYRNEEYKKLTISKRSKRTKQLICSQDSIPPLYNKPLPITNQKKRDLLQLCSKNVIPRELHPWYESLPTSCNARDTTGEPAVGDSDDD